MVSSYHTTPATAAIRSVAFITGINGQDGSYLAEFLLELGYEVWGLVRRASQLHTQFLDNIYHHPSLFLRYGDMTDSGSLQNILHELSSTTPFKRLEIYNLAAMSHVQVSFEMPRYTLDVDATGVLNLIEAIRVCNLTHHIRFYQASTSELYGDVLEKPQTELTPFNPQSPYGIAKLTGYWLVKHARETYGMYACNGILFNHESPRRGPTFVTRKITRGLAAILRGDQECLIMGNLDSKRDWSHAKDMVRAMWMMLGQTIPQDYVVASGIQVTIRECITYAFKLRGIQLEWQGSGLNEIGIDTKTLIIRVRISEKYFRPSDVTDLLGDSTRIRTELGWSPNYTFETLIEEMVNEDSPIPMIENINEVSECAADKKTGKMSDEMSDEIEHVFVMQSSTS